MMKSDVLGLISHYELAKKRAHSLDTECGDKKEVECDRVIIQCREVLKAMKSVDTEADILNGMIEVLRP